MNAKEYLNVALGGNMNFGTLKPLAIEEIMEGYAVHKNQYKIAREKSSEMIDDMLLQEIYSLQEKIKIITKMLKQFEPDLDIPMFLHALVHCDYEEWKDGCKENEDSINGVHASAHNSDYAKCKHERGSMLTENGQEWFVCKHCNKKYERYF